VNVQLQLILTPQQEAIDAITTRFKVIKAGRRFGKTRYALYWQLKKCLGMPSEDHWYLAPTYRMAYDIAWRELLRMVPQELVIDCNKRDFTIEFCNHARMMLKSSDNEDSLRGRRIGSIVIDEAAYHKPHIFSEVIRPMLADLRAPGLFISTPKRGWFTKLYDYAASDKDPEYSAFHYTIYDNPHISREEILQIKNTTSQHVWEREYLAEEVNEFGQVYTEFNNTSIFSPTEKFRDYKKWPCVVGIDWGFGDDTGVVWLHVNNEGHVIVSAEHLRSGWGVNRHCDIIKVKSRGLRIDVGNYVLDQSAFRTLDGNMSISDQFRREAIYCNRSIKDLDTGIDIVKRFLRGDGEKPWLYISTHCKNILSSLQSWEWDEHEPDILAALRYGLAHVYRKKLSTITDSITFKGDIPGGKPVDPNIHYLKIPPPSQNIRWDWDAGVPY